LPACTGSEFHVAVHGLLVRLMEVLHPGLHRNGSPDGIRPLGYNHIIKYRFNDMSLANRT
jgi:hypothetical protein